MKYESTVKCFSGYSLDTDILKKSSSGGIFYELAKYWMGDNGIAYGAAFNPDGTVSMQRVESIENIGFLMGSKYVTTHPNNIYSAVKKDLQNRKNVIFCSTPCKCNALSRYLGDKQYDNLLIVDFICHGVPSEMVWRKYLDRIVGDETIKHVSFRDKRVSWGKFGLAIQYGEESEYFSEHRQDPYMRLFLANRILRPSCHNCRSKGENRSSDISIGDFWAGGHNANASGCSVVMVRTEKGEIALEGSDADVVLHEISYDEAVKNNLNYFQSCGKPFNREKTLAAIRTDANRVFEHIEPYIRTNLLEKCIRKGIRIFKIITGTKDQKCYLGYRSIESFKFKALCSGCGAGVSACAKGAITMQEDREGFYYPVIDKTKCCECQRCIRVCLDKYGK